MCIKSIKCPFIYILNQSPIKWQHKVRIPSCKKAIEFMYCKAFEYVSVNY